MSFSSVGASSIPEHAREELAVVEAGGLGQRLLLHELGEESLDEDGVADAVAREHAAELARRDDGAAGGRDGGERLVHLVEAAHREVGVLPRPPG